MTDRCCCSTRAKVADGMHQFGRLVVDRLDEAVASRVARARHACTVQAKARSSQGAAHRSDCGMRHRLSGSPSNRMHASPAFDVPEPCLFTRAVLTWYQA